jgi:hypothetical protein
MEQQVALRLSCLQASARSALASTVTCQRRIRIARRPRSACGSGLSAGAETRSCGCSRARRWGLRCNRETGTSVIQMTRSRAAKVVATRAKRQVELTDEGKCVHMIDWLALHFFCVCGGLVQRGRFNLGGHLTTGSGTQPPVACNCMFDRGLFWMFTLRLLTSFVAIGPLVVMHVHIQELGALRASLIEQVT